MLPLPNLLPTLTLLKRSSLPLAMKGRFMYPSGQDSRPILAALDPSSFNWIPPSKHLSDSIGTSSALATYATGKLVPEVSRLRHLQGREQERESVENAMWMTVN